MKVFVYGTLRKGEINSHLLSEGNCIAEQARTNGKLYDTGFGFPVLKPSTTPKVYGELYEVTETELEKLDRLESYREGCENNYYERVVQKIYTDQGVYKAYVYVGGKMNNFHKQISSGDWKEHQIFHSQKERILYFAYGSCMDIKRIKEAGVHHYFENVIGKGVLHNYSLNFTHCSRCDGLGRADIVEGEGIVEGKMYDIPVECLSEYLYGREGAPRIYRPTFVTVEINGLKKEALTFTVVNKKFETAPPESYRNEILRGADGFLSEEYIASLIRHMDELEIMKMIGGN